MTDMIRAPWTPEQVAALNRFQAEGGMHPFTCGNTHATPDLHLVAHTDGWHCWLPDCDYRQDWAHRFMADPDTWPKSLAELREAAPGEPDPLCCCRHRSSAHSGIGCADCRMEGLRILSNHSFIDQHPSDAAEQAVRTTPDNPPASGDVGDEHVCEPGATVYFCPTSGATESDCHGGFGQCCDRPDLHYPASTVLRDRIAAALLARIKQATIPRSGQHGQIGSLLAATEFDLADTVLTALAEHLDIGDAEAWCKTCRRVWEGRSHRCESDAEQALARVRELAADVDDPTWRAPGTEVAARIRLALCGYPAAHDGGPDVAEAARDDRRWGFERHGE